MMVKLERKKRIQKIVRRTIDLPEWLAEMIRQGRDLVGRLEPGGIVPDCRVGEMALREVRHGHFLYKDPPANLVSTVLVPRPPVFACSR